MKAFQANLSKLIKEYDNLPMSGADETELNNEIKELEAENAKLSKQIKEL